MTSLRGSQTQIQLKRLGANSVEDCLRYWTRLTDAKPDSPTPKAPQGSVRVTDLWCIKTLQDLVEASGVINDTSGFNEFMQLHASFEVMLL